MDGGWGQSAVGFGHWNFNLQPLGIAPTASLLDIWSTKGPIFFSHLMSMLSGPSWKLQILDPTIKRGGYKYLIPPLWVVVQSSSCVWLFETPWTAACQASLSLTISWSLPKFISIASVILSSHLILWRCLLFPHSIFPSIRDFSSESSVRIGWPKYWSFSFSIGPFSEYSGLSPLRLTGLISLLSKGLSGVFSSTTVRRHQFFGVLPSLQSSCHNRTWPLGRPQRWLYKPLSGEECLCFTTHCLGSSWLSCQEAIAFWFHGCSHHLQWF